jgi:hypothetical protein
VAFALHAVIGRKPANDARQPAPPADAAADRFAPWADYGEITSPLRHAASDKGYNFGAMAGKYERGAALVTFADGWSKRVDISAAKAGRNAERWNIAPAVRFAVLCYRLALARRLTGSTDCMHHHRTGNMAGLTVTLDHLFTCPEIASIVSDDGAGTTAGEVEWNPADANAATAELRAGRFTAPDTIGPFPRMLIEADDAPLTAAMRAEITAARASLLDSMGHDGTGIRTAMRARVAAIAERVSLALHGGRYGNEPGQPCGVSKHAAQDTLREVIEADRDAYPMDDDMLARTEAQRQAIEADAAMRAHVHSRPVIDAATWTIRRDGEAVCMSEVFPDHVVFVGKWSNRHASPQAYDPATVEGLAPCQSGRLATLATAMCNAPRGVRIAGPRKTMKRLRAMIAARDAERDRPMIEARERADEILGDYQEWADDFTKPMQWNMVERRGAILDALLAWPALDDAESAETPPVRPETPALAIVASNPAPIALAGPAVLLCLPKPSPANAKPRYRLTAAGQFERIAA